MPIARQRVSASRYVILGTSRRSVRPSCSWSLQCSRRISKKPSIALGGLPWRTGRSDSMSASPVPTARPLRHDQASIRTWHRSSRHIDTRVRLFRKSADHRTSGGMRSVLATASGVISRWRSTLTTGRFPRMRNLIPTGNVTRVWSRSCANPEWSSSTFASDPNTIKPRSSAAFLSLTSERTRNWPQPSRSATMRGITKVTLLTPHGRSPGRLRIKSTGTFSTCRSHFDRTRRNRTRDLSPTSTGSCARFCGGPGVQRPPLIHLGPYTSRPSRLVSSRSMVARSTRQDPHGSA